MPGVFLRVAHPVRASLQLASWNDPERVRCVLCSMPSVRPAGQRPAGPKHSMSALRRPLGPEHATRSAWPSLSLIGAVLALVYAGRHASFTVSREALLLVGFVFLLSGGFLDTRLGYQERGGLARVMSVGLAGTGLMIAIASHSARPTYG